MNNIFLQELSALGYDVDGAIKRCDNDTDFYLQCIQMTMEDNSIHQLGDALERNDVKSAFSYAHTLKGVWANVGFTTLYQMIIPVVERLRVGHSEGVKADYDKIVSEYAKLQKLYKNR